MDPVIQSQLGGLEVDTVCSASSTAYKSRLDQLATLTIIVAMTASRVIGKDGVLPWRLPEDLKRFKAMTIDRAIIMGRKTYDSIGRPLPGRMNIVVSRQSGLSISGCQVVLSLDEAIERSRQFDDEPIVIGGGEIYVLALPRATRLHITYVYNDVEGDAFFPEFGAPEWIESSAQYGYRCGDAFRYSEFVRMR